MIDLPVITKVSDPEDIEAVAALAHEIWNQHFVPIAGQKQVDYMLEKLQSAPAIAKQISSGYQYYTIAVDNEMVGYFAIASVPDECIEAQLSKIYVRKDHQGQGLGKDMLDFAEELCAAMGIRKLWLTVYRHNVETIAFYEHMGFTMEGKLVQDIGDGFVMDDYRMEKIL